MIKKITKRLLSLFLTAFVTAATATAVMAADPADDPYAVEVTFENEAVRGSVEVIKYKTDKRTVLPGVTFKLQSPDATVVKEAVTDSNGKVSFTDLMPGSYTITETKAPDGYALLKDPIEVTVPYGVEQTKAEADGLDVSKAVLYNGTYYFYDLKYEVADDVTFTLPMTGFFDHWTNYIWIVAACVFIGAGCVSVIKQRKRTVKQ